MRSPEALEFCAWTSTCCSSGRSSSKASMMMAPAAFADEIGDAAKKLGDAS